MFYFFKTMSDRGRNRLRPLAGQVLSDGSAVDQTLNVQSDKALRTRYPLGTVFGSDSLVIRSGYYEASQIYPIFESADEYLDATDKPSNEMMDAYRLLMSGIRPIATESRETTSAKKKSTLLSRMKSNEEFLPPTIDKNGFYVSPANWYLLMRNIQNQKNTMMIGPTGTGKTELIMLACEKLGIPCSVYDMGSMYDPVAGLLGVHRLNKGGVSVFDYAKFTQDVQKPGVILLDELSRAPVTSLNILFPCLDSRRCLPVEIAGGEDMRSIKIHEDCCFVATANVGSEYTGTMSMDRALVGRFFPIELDYMPIESEMNVLVKRCGITELEAKHIASVAQNVRSIYKKQEISCSLSTRETLMAAEMVADGWSVLEAMEAVFLPLFEGTAIEGERSIIKKCLAAR